MAHNASNFLFTGLDRPIAMRDLSVKLLNTFNKKIGFKMSLGTFCQFMSFISDCNAPIFDAASVVNKATAEQFGHTAGMHTGHYVLDERLPYGISHSLYLRTARNSAASQILFEFGSELMEALSADSHRIQALTSKVLAIRTGQAPSTTALVSDGPAIHLSTEVAIQSFISAIQDRLLPPLYLHLTRALAQCFSAVVDLFAPYRVFPRAPGLPTASHSLTHPYLLECLRRFMKNPNANFFNPAQADATQLMFDRKDHFAYISATGQYFLSLSSPVSLTDQSPGTGKTTPGMLNACLLDDGRSTLWPVLLSSMHPQLERICKENGATCESWSLQSRANNPPNVILVTIEKTEATQFHAYVVQLVNANLLVRIIVDEAHLAIAHNFRSIMHTLTWAASKGVQLVLQSATIPPSLEALTFKAFGVTAYSVVRASTARPNISYNVIRVADHDEMHAQADQLLERILKTPSHGSVLIFCRSQALAEEFGHRNNIPCCHAGLSQEEARQILKDLHDGKICAVVCTTILGVSLNETSVSHVIHIDYPYNTLGLIQESGRSGRLPDTLAWSYVIVVEGSGGKVEKEDLLGARLVRAAIDNDRLCRRLLLWGFNDGTALPCAMLQGNVHYCDVCRRTSSLRPVRGARPNFTTELIQEYLPKVGQ